MAVVCGGRTAVAGGGRLHSPGNKTAHSPNFRTCSIYFTGIGNGNKLPAESSSGEAGNGNSGRQPAASLPRLLPVTNPEFESAGAGKHAYDLDTYSGETRNLPEMHRRRVAGSLLLRWLQRRLAISPSSSAPVEFVQVVSLSPGV